MADIALTSDVVLKNRTQETKAERASRDLRAWLEFGKFLWLL